VLCIDCELYLSWIANLLGLSQESMSMMYSPVQLVMDAVSSFNGSFLEALQQSARDRPESFPLCPTLIDGFRALTAPDCREIAGSVRICLADARFSDEAWWSSAASMPARARQPGSDPWIPETERVPLAQSLLIVAWHGVRSLPSFSRVLFGMRPGVQRAFEQLSLFQLFGLSRSPASAVCPRWSDRTDIWSHILGDSTRGLRALSVDLRILQACASESSGMLNRAALEFVDDLSSQHHPRDAQSENRPAAHEPK
jgi:hypothetical protein